MSARRALIIMPNGLYRRELLGRLKKGDKFRIMKSYHEFGDGTWESMLEEVAKYPDKRYVSESGSINFVAEEDSYYNGNELILKYRSNEMKKHPWAEEVDKRVFKQIMDEYKDKKIDELIDESMHQRYANKKLKTEYYSVVDVSKILAPPKRKVLMVNVRDDLAKYKLPEVQKFVKFQLPNVKCAFPALNLFEEIKCECGGDKTRTTHSNWCPKHES